jgi:hypothetical protein
MKYTKLFLIDGININLHMIHDYVQTGKIHLAYIYITGDYNVYFLNQKLAAFNYPRLVQALE